jgi:uncharacterized protein YjbI with pentapeptide repeats
MWRTERKKEGIMVKKVLFVGLAVMLLQWALFSGLSLSFDNAHLQQFNSTNKCEKCDLSGANFSNVDMTGARLIGANLSGANLSDAIFSDTNLTDANLTGANIKGTNFSGAKLSNATWIDGRKCKPGSMGKCK